MQAGHRRGSGDVTQRFFPAGRCFLANRFAGWSVPEGSGGRGRQAGRGQSPQQGSGRGQAAQAARGGTGRRAREPGRAAQAAISRGETAGSCLN